VFLLFHVLDTYPLFFFLSKISLNFGEKKIANIDNTCTSSFRLRRNSSINPSLVLFGAKQFLKIIEIELKELKKNQKKNGRLCCFGFPSPHERALLP